jgi:dihydrofolate synthase/folylpolyglutamate synthase
MSRDSARNEVHFADIDEAIAYVEGFAVRPPGERETIPPRQRQAARLPLMAELLDVLGNPQQRLRAAHIAGTSGKGSTVAMLASIVRAAGLRVGAYINPYVTRPQERVQIDGADIGDDAFIAAAHRVAGAVDIIEARHPGFLPHFKQVFVALMFVALEDARVDLAVIETGMGGRFDETSLARPDVTIVTTVGTDHREFLGDTVAEIAWHKAGIIKPGVPAVTGASDSAALAVIRAEAGQAHAPLDVLGFEFSCSGVTTDLTGTRFTYCDEALGHVELATGLAGMHQAHNAALAVRAARRLMPDIALDTLRAGLWNAWLPGRFEIVAEAPLAVLDVAHNPEKMQALAATLSAVLRWRRLWVVFGTLESKDTRQMLAALAPLAHSLIITAPAVAGRRSTPPDAVASMARDLGLPVAATESDPRRAAAVALANAAPDDVIVVTGSLFLVSQVRPLWRA